MWAKKKSARRDVFLTLGGKFYIIVHLPEIKKGKIFSHNAVGIQSRVPWQSGPYEREGRTVQSGGGATGRASWQKHPNGAHCRSARNYVESPLNSSHLTAQSVRGVAKKLPAVKWSIVI